MMNITDLAHIADIVAAIGIIGSMIFVGVQVHQSRRSTRSSTLEQQANQYAKYTDVWEKVYAGLSDPRVATIFAKGSAGRDLEKAEFNQFFIMCRLILTAIENLHQESQRGLLDKDVYARFLGSSQEELFAFPGIRAIWQLTRHHYDSDFAEYLDEIVASTSIHQPQSTYKKWKELSQPIRQRLSTGEAKISGADVHYWPLADIPSCTAHVRLWG